MSNKSSSSVLNVAVDQRFQITPDGRVWTYTPPSYEFFLPALQVFGKVRVIARTASVGAVPTRGRLVNGPNVEVVPIPYYVGPFHYLLSQRRVKATLANVASMDGAFLLRIPSQLAFDLYEQLQRRNRAYAVELLADPSTFFAPGVAPNSLATWFRPYFCRQTRLLCSRASAANYVTGQRTRLENPPLAAKWSSNLSDIELSEKFFLPIELKPFDGLLEIATVGFLDFLVKGQDVLLKALAECHRSGLQFRITFVGDGAKKGYLLHLAEQLGIRRQVCITGALGGALEVREILRKSHLSILASRSEGIPRAVIESMAVGTPVIGSTVGAMPDLLDPEWIVPVNDVSALARKILSFSRHPEVWTKIALRNYETALQYEASRLVPRRIEFFRAIRDQVDPLNLALTICCQESTCVA